MHPLVLEAWLQELDVPELEHPAKTPSDDCQALAIISISQKRCSTRASIPRAVKRTCLRSTLQADAVKTRTTPRLAQGVMTPTKGGRILQGRSKRGRGNAHQPGGESTSGMLPATTRLNPTPPDTLKDDGDKNEEEDEDDDEPTPRPAPMALIHSRILELEQMTTPLAPNGADKARSDTSGNSARSSGTDKSRSRSPVKSMRDMRMLERPIRETALNAGAMGLEISRLAEGIENLALGFGVLPAAIKTRCMGYIRSASTAYGHAQCFAPPLDPDTPDYAQKIEYDVDCFKWACKAYAGAKLCSTQRSPEAVWNERVHSRILEIAVDYEGSNVGFQNITTAKIQPPSLLPMHLSGTYAQGKMVDYALFLHPTEDILDKIISKCSLQPPNFSHVNQTDFQALRYEPIGVSIQTKRQDGNSEAANVQLSTWGHAQTTRLRMLSGSPTVPIIFLPMILIHGHDWELRILEDRNQKLLFYEPISMGDTRSLLGIYRIIAGLRILARWIETDFSEWFQSRILGLTLTKLGSQPLSHAT